MSRKVPLQSLTGPFAPIGWSEAGDGAGGPGEQQREEHLSVPAAQTDRPQFLDGMQAVPSPPGGHGGLLKAPPAAASLCPLCLKGLLGPSSFPLRMVAGKWYFCSSERLGKV